MIKETLAFLLKNSYSESSTLVLETLNLQRSWIAPSNVTQASDPSIQASKQQEQLRTDTTNKKESFKRAYKRIELTRRIWKILEKSY
jgi:hypothetical protein